MKKVFLSWFGILLLLGCQNVLDPEPSGCSNGDLQLIEIGITNASNCSSTDGGFQVSASGGEGPYEFRIDNQVFGSNADFSGLTSGIYTVEVRDKIGCLQQLKVTILAESGASLTSIDTTNSGCETSEGSITIQVSNGIGLSYTIDGVNYVSTNAFTNLTRGDYLAGFKDNDGCGSVTSVTINSGVNYSIIKDIINNNCAVSGCHNGGGGLLNLSDDNNIVSNASSIKLRTGNKSMPKKGSGFVLTNEQIQLIACWVDDGAILN